MSNQQYPGSRWWKFDFHTHTPASSDYRGDKEISYTQWLRDYKDLGLQCVVLTDHNSGFWIDLLKSALEQLKQQEQDAWNDFTLFPGMELSCNGGVHLNVILDPQKSTADIEAIRGLVRYQGTPGDSNGVTQLSVEQVIDAIHSAGGIACAAHIDQPKGLLTSVTDHHTLDAILKKLDAVETIELSADCLQNANPKLGKLASVLGSDSHQPKEIGRGFTWVKMSKPSFDGLRLALLDPESAIRRSDLHPDAPQQLPEQWIESISLENMHLRRNGHGALSLSFNPAYNAIIGGRGSGKSTVLECLRLGLAREGELRKLGDDSEIWKTFEGFRREYVQRDKPGMMLPETKISVVVIKGKKEASQRYKFVWSKQPNGRFATQVMRWDEGAWQETGLDEQQASELFPVKIFSQKQILALANNPQALLEHIDNSIREQKIAWLQQFDLLKSALLAARLRVRTLKKELEKKPALELEYKEASRKARVFANANFGPLLKAHQRATQQQRALDDFYQILAKDIAGLQAGIEQAANLAGAELTQFLVETPAEIAARDNAITLKSQLVTQYQQIVATVSAMQGQLDAAQAARTSGAWYQENQVHIQAYQNEAARLKGEGINGAQDAAIAVATEERLRKQLEQIKIFEAELEQAESAVELAAHKLTDCREALTQAREVFVNWLLEQNDMLKISLRSMASVKDGVGDLRQILKLPDSARFEDVWFEDEDGKTSGFLSDVVDPVIASSVGERLQNKKIDIEGKSRNILRTTLHGALVKRLEAINEEAFDELAWWFPDDEVTLEYRPKKKDAYKNINLASAGQKTAAMLSFLLVHGDEPLLLDQPEDDLDNALVSELVVEQLRKNKVHRQLLVVTHNANIVVNADAELVMTMDFNGQITLASAGGLQETVVRKDICRVMEGGEEAFRQRYKRILEDLEVRP
jgi:ABC-type lipoprotein export system ATPase subunit/histidinol phosphatase-like PHP family hydrolase